MVDPAADRGLVVELDPSELLLSGTSFLLDEDELWESSEIGVGSDDDVRWSATATRDAYLGGSSSRRSRRSSS